MIPFFFAEVTWKWLFYFSLYNYARREANRCFVSLTPLAIRPYGKGHTIVWQGTYDLMARGERLVKHSFELGRTSLASVSGAFSFTCCTPHQRPSAVIRTSSPPVPESFFQKTHCNRLAIDLKYVSLQYDKQKTLNAYDTTRCQSDIRLGVQIHNV